MTASTALDNGQFRTPACFETKAVDGVGSVWNEELRIRDKVFPYEFGMLKSEVSSPGSEEIDDDDEFFASLTQRLTLYESRNVSLLDLHKSPGGLKSSGGSPQSTLGGIGNWSGRSSNGSNHNSPPATPFESKEDTLGLIYAAAGQVAKLERNVEDPLQAALNGQRRALAKPKPLQNPTAVFCADLQMKQNHLAAARQANEAALFWEHHLQNMKINSINRARSEVSYHSGWPRLQNGTVTVKPNFQTIPLQRKESAGTGVFIPRRYDSSSIVPPRKKTIAPCALVPSKVIQALNTSIETINATSLTHCNPVPNNASSIQQQSYDALMARRRALLDQQQRSMTKMTEDISSRSIEACLPQEWSY